MSNDKRNEFHGEILTPEIARKGIILLGDVDRTPPDVGIFDPPTRCFIVNQEWWSHIAGMVHLLADVRSWKEAEDDDYFAITEILKFMQGMDCMDFMMRQSPDDFCILEQSLDGGTTWTTVFDFSLCLAITEGSTNVQNNNIFNNYTNAVNNFQNYTYNNYVENYVDSVTDVHPELGYGDADDSFRDDALCYALGKLVDALCQSAIEIINQSAETSDDVKTSLAVVGAVLGILLLAGSGIGLPAATLLSASLIASGIGLGAAVGTAVFDFLLGKSADIFQNAEAKQEVVCDLFTTLAGSDVDHADLISAFSGASGLSSDAMDIADFGEILITELAYYAAFTESYAVAFQSAKLGLLPACPCDAGTWCFMWEFDAGLDTWTQNVGVHPYTEAGSTGFGSTSPNPCIIEIQKTINEFVSSVTIGFFGVGSGSNNLKVYNGASLIYDGVFVSTLDINATVTTLKIRSQRAFAYGIGTVSLTGTGSNPFGMDNCP